MSDSDVMEVMGRMKQRVMSAYDAVAAPPGLPGLETGFTLTLTALQCFTIQSSLSFFSKEMFGEEIPAGVERVKVQ